MKIADTRTIVASWGEHEKDLFAIRHQVFVVEQAVDPELEWDGLDAQCIHVLVHNAEDKPVATGRLAKDGKIGRMAVLKADRGKGYGALVMKALLEQAKRMGLRRVYLHAQCSALAFYQRSGFQAYGPIFDEADILHRKMERLL